MKQTFTPEQFTATKWTTAEEKAKFANHFIKFVLSGYRPALFYNWFYLTLQNCFRHIAHFHKEGFYNTWFSSRIKQADFLLRCVAHLPLGCPAFTYYDVEKKLIAWIKRSSGLLETSIAAATLARREGNLAIRDQLLISYPLEEYPMQTDVLLIE